VTVFYDRSMATLSGFEISLYDISESDLKTIFVTEFGPVLRLFLKK
jgi:hypothetical protein